MLPIAPEKVISISQYKYTEDAKEVKILVTGLTPAFAPMTVTKGKPETMEELRKALERLFEVEVTLCPLGK